MPLSVEQVRVLAEAMPVRNRAMVLAQAGLGLGSGSYSRCAPRCRLLAAVSTCRVAGRSWGKTHSDAKTPRSRRTLPLPAVVAEALAAHMAAFPPAEDGTLFTTRTGRPYRHDYYESMIFAAAVRRADLTPGTTSHDLRHHFASVLLAAGESVVAVAERLGHENAALVLSTYGHLMPDSEERTRRAIDEA